MKAPAFEHIASVTDIICSVNFWILIQRKNKIKIENSIQLKENNKINFICKKKGKSLSGGFIWQYIILTTMNGRISCNTWMITVQKLFRNSAGSTILHYYQTFILWNKIYYLVWGKKTTTKWTVFLDIEQIDV